MKKATLLFPRLLTCYLSPALVFLFMLVTTRLVAQTELWGLTSDGAAGSGSIIKLNTDGSGFANFAFENQGAHPYADLLESGGKFYGMTAGGGSNYRGVLFEYDPAGAGTYTVKHHFGGANGSYPYGSLIESGGKFYGMTREGGSNSRGVLFEFDPAGAGTYTVKHHFDWLNGAYPFGSLIESGGKFYGMTSQGSFVDCGVLFEYDPDGAGTYTVKHHFDCDNGGFPYGSLIAWDGKFYGMTSRGGGLHGTSDDSGMLFEYDPAGVGTYTVKHHFEGANGRYPHGSLITSGGKFYGMTSEGGFGDYGVLFEYDPAGGGAYTVLRHLEFADGIRPYGDLIAVPLVSATTSAEGPAFEMRVSPNPSGGQVVIQIISEKNLSGNLAIYDLQGRQITELAKERIFQGQERIVWQPTDLPAGVYFLRLQTEAGVYVEKFIKQ